MSEDRAKKKTSEARECGDRSQDTMSRMYANTAGVC